MGGNLGGNSDTPSHVMLPAADDDDDDGSRGAQTASRPAAPLAEVQKGMRAPALTSEAAAHFKHPQHDNQPLTTGASTTPAAGTGAPCARSLPWQASCHSSTSPLTQSLQSRVNSRNEPTFAPRLTTGDAQSKGSQVSNTVAGATGNSTVRQNTTTHAGRTKPSSTDTDTGNVIDAWLLDNSDDEGAGALHGSMSHSRPARDRAGRQANGKRPSNYQGAAGKANSAHSRKADVSHVGGRSKKQRSASASASAAGSATAPVDLDSSDNERGGHHSGANLGEPLPQSAGGLSSTEDEDHVDEQIAVLWPPLKPRCKYDALAPGSCYRTNPKHLVECAHTTSHVRVFARKIDWTHPCGPLYRLLKDGGVPEYAECSTRERCLAALDEALSRTEDALRAACSNAARQSNPPEIVD